MSRVSSKRRPGRFRRAGLWLSVITCIVLLLAWVSSCLVGVVYTAGVGFWFGEHSWYFSGQIWLADGALGVGRHEGDPGADEDWPRWQFYVPNGSLGLALPSFESFDHPCIGGSWLLHVPLWLLMAPCGLLTLWLWPRPGRDAGGPRCTACGYNLTGNVSGVCPECGVRVTAA